LLGYWDAVGSGGDPWGKDGRTSHTDRRALQAYLDRPLDDLMEQLELYDPASRGPAEAWNKVAGPVRQRLCVEWGWCEVRQDQRWDDDLSRRMNSLLKLRRPLRALICA
jgi:hypothetical protein